MLNIPGPRAVAIATAFRAAAFLKAGTFAFGATAFNMVDVLRAEVRAGTSSPHKAVINIFLGGGQAHQDMWEIKTEAPVEIRGEFNPISTSVPGIQISEIFPRIASLMHKCVVIRSVTGCQDRHDAVQCLTGFPGASLQPIGGRPSIGATVTRLQGSVEAAVPPFVGLTVPTTHRPWSDPGQTGFLGPAYVPFKPDGPSLENMTLTGITTNRFNDRRQMLSSFDNLRREIDANATMQALDSAQNRALDVLTSNKLVRALDITQESASVRERYGDGKPYNFQYDGAPTVNDQLLMARRLVEAGVRCVTLTFGRWDSHGQNFPFMRDHGGKLDQCLSALIEDLDVRGMLNDTTVAVWGEFGRTPRINASGGRDHWAPVSCCLLAGGGMRTGQAIGSTNRLGEVAATRPVSPGEIVASIYRNLGIAANTTIIDPTGRPQFLSDQSPLPELV